MKDCKTLMQGCCVPRIDVVGIVLIIVASILTILTFNRVGIAMMFIVGAFLTAHQCFSRCCGCATCRPSCDDVCDEGTATVKKSSAKKTAE